MIPEFERYRSEIEGLKSPPVPDDKAFYERSDLINENFRIFTDGKLSAYYAPFDYINRKARVVLVGLTPGWTQMERAFRTAKRSIAEGLSGDELLRSIKTSASFSGAMRKNLVSMLDGIELNQHLQLLSCGELFNIESALVHFTSAISMPTFIDGKNFSGHGVSCLKLPQFRQFIIDNLAMELALLPDAIIVPLGKVVDQVLEFLREEKRIDLAQTWRAFRIRRV